MRSGSWRLPLEIAISGCSKPGWRISSGQAKDQASGSTWGNRDHACHQGDVSGILANSTESSLSMHVSWFKNVLLDLTQRGFIRSINCSHSLSGSCRGGAATPFAEAMFPFRSPFNPEKQQKNGGIFCCKSTKSSRSESANSRGPDIRRVVPKKGIIATGQLAAGARRAARLAFRASGERPPTR
jgi:hypothetical protein